MKRKRESRSIDPRPAGGGEEAAVRPAWLVVILVAVACAVYANACTDALVLDDKPYLHFERYGDVSALARHFFENAWAVSGLDSVLYRPLLLVSIAVDANVFEERFAGYHLVNVLWHVAVVLLVFAFISRLLTMDGRSVASSHLAAFLAALIFASHPVHTETVNQIFNRSSLMAAAGVVGGLWWLLTYVNDRPVRAWTGALLAYTFALFCRETAAVMPGIAVALVFLYADGDARRRIGRTLPALLLALPLIAYLQLRGMAISNTGGAAATTGSGLDVALAPFTVGGALSDGRLLLLAKSWAEALWMLAWPFDLRVSYLHSRGAAAPAVMLHLGLIALGLYGFARGRKGLLTGLMIFYLCMLPASRLFTDGLVQPLRLRYLYLSSIGPMVLLAYAFDGLNKRWNALATVVPVALLVVALGSLSWSRNTLWANEIALFESDYRKGNPSSFLLQALTAAHMREQNHIRAMELCDAHEKLLEISGVLAVNCGIAYRKNGRPGDAERAYLVGTRYPESRWSAGHRLAQKYLRDGRWEDAKALLEGAVAAEPDPARKAFQTGYMLLKLYPRSAEKRSEAARYFEQALELNPRLNEARTFLARTSPSPGGERG